jgi:hypothetical protein
MTISAVLMFALPVATIYFPGPQVGRQGNPVESPIVMYAVVPVFYLIPGCFWW